MARFLAIALLLPGTRGDGCIITAKVCRNFPEFNRTQFRDTLGEEHLGAGTEAAACLKRAEDFHHWCGNGPEPGASVASTFSKEAISQIYDAGACVPGWSQFDAFCYKFFLEMSTWAEAEATCRDLNSHLVSIHSRMENSFVHGLAHGLKAQASRAPFSPVSDSTSFLVAATLQIAQPAEMACKVSGGGDAWTRMVQRLSQRSAPETEEEVDREAAPETLITLHLLHASGRSLPMSVDTKNTINEVKKLIREVYEREGPPPGYSEGSLLKLVRGTDEVEDDGRSVLEHGIEDGDTLTIILQESRWQSLAATVRIYELPTGGALGNYRKSLQVWIGYTDIDQDMRYTWSDNTQDDFTNFVKNCSGRESEAGCSQPEVQQQWYQSSGIEKSPFVCKKNAQLPVSLQLNTTAESLLRIAWPESVPATSTRQKELRPRIQATLLPDRCAASSVRRPLLPRMLPASV
ncbi:Snaclec 4 [Symbiodinium microadriaticum]|uniref:Snaclec 4 n=1 Tax=Symbiodinium microadriaticum TaxID=2951 RepID=A0A1Q9DSH0_SYMMI|nr:Snaclec 4 [Symbiodinium microadriaticum]